MKRLHGSHHRSTRIIHISIRGLSSARSTQRNQTSISSHRTIELSQTPISHLTLNSNTTSSYSNHVVFTISIGLQIIVFYISYR